MTPQLALQYSSGGGPSPFGYGWDLPLGRIERSSAWGTPRCSGPHTDDFVLVLPTGRPSWCASRAAARTTARRSSRRGSAPRSAGAENQWRVVDRSGRTYTFGDVDAARVANSTPATFMAQCGHALRLHRRLGADPHRGSQRQRDRHRVEQGPQHPLSRRPSAGARTRHAGVRAPVHRALSARVAPDRRSPRQLSPRRRSRVWCGASTQIDVDPTCRRPGTAVRSYTLQYRDDPGGAGLPIDARGGRRHRSADPALRLHAQRDRSRRRRRADRPSAGRLRSAARQPTTASRCRRACST